MNDETMEVILNSHNFSVKHYGTRMSDTVKSFMRKYNQWGMVRENGSIRRGIIRGYFANPANGEPRFHINALDAFKAHIEACGLSLSGIKFTNKAIPPAVDADITSKGEKTLREEQEQVVNYILDKDNRSKIVQAATGFGKSLVAVETLCRVKKRTIVIIKPMYMKQWHNNFFELTQLLKEEVLMVQGSEALIKLLKDPEKYKDVSVIILSNVTYRNYLDSYEEGAEKFEQDGYPIEPHILMEYLGIGFRLIDEGHQDFHLNFRMDLYTNVEKSLTLTATLVSDDAFVSRMQYLAYPINLRYAGLTYVPYIRSTAYGYSFDRPEFIRTTEYGSTTYSHTALEKSIKKNPILFTRYVKLIEENLDIHWKSQTYQDGDKAIVFCALVDFCEAVAKQLREKYPDKVVNTFTDGAPLETLSDSDIIVSTLLSAGTARDIPKLTTVVMTVALSSTSLNLQCMGRLRRLPDNRTPNFVYFTCVDIPKHLDYHKKKKEIINSRVVSLNIQQNHRKI